MRSVIILALLCGAGVAQTADSGAAGFIFKLQGSWTSQRTGKPIRNLDPVFPHERISAGRPSPNSALSISLYDGTPISLRCRSAKDCDPPYTVPDTRPQPDSLLARVVRALRLLYPAETSRIQIPAVRGTGPEEAVVPILPNGTLDLAAALRALPPGVYAAELLASQPEGVSSSPIAMHLEWRMSRAIVTDGVQVPAGLYQLTLLTPDSENLGRAMILAAPGASYPQLHESFDRLRTLTETWLKASDEGSVRQFRAEYLVALQHDPNLAGPQ